MVWPILISVAVTPRISAASAAFASTTSAPNAPNTLTERIGFSPVPVVRRAGFARLDRYLAPACGQHAMAQSRMPFAICAAIRVVDSSGQDMEKVKQEDA